MKVWTRVRCIQDLEYAEHGELLGAKVAHNVVGQFLNTNGQAVVDKMLLVTNAVE